MKKVYIAGVLAYIAVTVLVISFTDAATRKSGTDHSFEVNYDLKLKIDDDGSHFYGGLFPRVVNDAGMDATLGKGPGELVYNLADSKAYVHINANTPMLGAQYWSPLN